MPIARPFAAGDVLPVEVRLHLVVSAHVLAQWMAAPVLDRGCQHPHKASLVPPGLHEVPGYLHTLCHLGAISD